MKHRLFYTVGLIVAVMVAFATSSAEAASGNGPYYSSPSWDEKLACTKASNCPRFIVLVNWSSAAVLDKETGLVWERSPSTTPLDWYTAQSHCNSLNLGNRLGWQMPTMQELASLMDGDPANTSSPKLPPGHPFFNVQSSVYWSATTYAVATGSAWDLNFGDGQVFNDPKSLSNLVWCVRGGQGVDPQ